MSLPNLGELPAWALDAVLGLVSALAKLLSATTDEEREDALMSAAEAVKASLDRKRFG